MRLPSFLTVLLPLILFYLPSQRCSEIFSAITHMKHLLGTEQSIVETLHSYLDSEERRLKNLRTMYNHYKQIDDASMVDSNEVILHPLNAFLLLKRLSEDWKVVQYLIKGDDSKDLLADMIYNSTFPTETDLKGAANALLRLQQVYGLDVNSLAEGVIPSTVVNNPEQTGVVKNHISAEKMSANDCYHLGLQSYHNEFHAQTIQWMEEALRLANEGRFHLKETLPERLKVKILEYLSYSLYKEGYIHEAYEYTQQLLALDPMHELALDNAKIFFKRMTLFERKERSKMISTEEARERELVALTPDWDPDVTMNTYEALCRGEQLMSEQNRSQLTCFYADTRLFQDKYFLLWKIQVEEANKLPHIVQIHEVITDAEIEILKEISQKRLKRATVSQKGLTGTAPSDIRVSQSFFIPDSEDPVVATLSRRMEGITGMVMSTAEHLQIGNYGIGGHYEPHVDYSRTPGFFKDLNTGNRLATWMFYMSDVTAGGATVFPHVGATIWPRKGSAAFWHNMRSDGEGDLLTRHAGCPVLVGSKWVANKWIHEYGQEFRKPCHLKQDQFLVFQPNRH